MTDFYVSLDHAAYKSLETQMLAFAERETTHTSVNGYYHKSIKLDIGGVDFEFHGPNVKAQEPLPVPEPEPTPGSINRREPPNRRKYTGSARHLSGDERRVKERRKE